MQRRRGRRERKRGQSPVAWMMPTLSEGRRRRTSSAALQHSWNGLWAALPCRIDPQAAETPRAVYGSCGREVKSIQLHRTKGNPLGLTNSFMGGNYFLSAWVVRSLSKAARSSWHAPVCRPRPRAHPSRPRRTTPPADAWPTRRRCRRPRRRPLSARGGVSLARFRLLRLALASVSSSFH